MKNKIVAVVSAGMWLAAAATAAELDIWSRTINNDTNGVWHVQPDKPKSKDVKAPGIPGEMALRVKARQGANPWDVQASSPVAGAIAEGDIVMVMAYLRAEQPAEGGSKISLRVQLAGAPYTSTMDFTAPITTEWQSYCAHRVATAGMPAGKGNVNVHLATAQQVIDLGPVFVFNFGPGFDRTKLKGCDG
ncbi:MAG TPA: hypothetical protein VM146_01045 [Steroidobacteraceae bacterium]|nr:hypothetical protein [Steroidobacteraceae bacterium]